MFDQDEKDSKIAKCSDCDKTGTIDEGDFVRGWDGDLLCPECFDLEVEEAQTYY